MRRDALTLGLTLAASLAIQGTAGASAGPELESTFPRHLGAARSTDVLKVTATYDRDLAPPPFSHMDLDAGCGPGAHPAVPGDDELGGPQSDTGGLRTMKFSPNVPLAEGCYTANVAARALVGTEPTFSHFTFAIDDTPPAAPVVTDPASGQIRDDQPMQARGTAEAGTQVSIVEGDDVIGSGEASSLGTFSITLPYGLEDAVSHTIVAFAVDRAQNKGPSSPPTTFVHDSAPKQPPEIVTPAEGAFLSTTGVVVSGTAKPSTTVQIDETGATLASAPADTHGNWSATITFSPGTHTITATSFDGISPDGPSPGRTFTIDVAAPAAPVIVTPPEGAHLARSEVVVSGAAEPLGTVRVREGALLRATAAVDAAGGWSATIPFTEGPHTITASAVDRAGNESGTATRSFTVDTVAPVAPAIASPAESEYVGTSTVTVSGAAEASTTVTVFEGTAAIGATTASGSGAWSVAIAFADGAHRLTARATDAAGNSGPHSPARTFTVDTVAPATPSIELPAEGSTVTTATVTVSGTGEPMATVTVTEGSLAIGTAAVGQAGTWGVRIDFANGTHAIAATASDETGNASALSAVRTFTVSAPADGVAPAPPVITAPADGSLQPGQVTFRGTAEAGATVRVVEGSAAIGSATATATGWTLTAQLPSGPHTVTATAADPFGNQSAPSAPVSFTVDAGRPSVAITTPDHSVFGPGDPLVVSGTASDDSGVAGIDLEYRDALGRLVLSQPAVCTGCPGTGATWSHAPSLGPGVYGVRATAVDVVGNRSGPAAIGIVRL